MPNNNKLTLLLVAGLGLGCAAREISLDGDDHGDDGDDHGRETGSETTSSSGTSGSDDEDDVVPDLDPSCSVLDQDCPVGQKCTYLSHEEPLTACVEASGPWPAGLPCTWKGDGLDTCDASSICWDWWHHPWDPELEGVCVPFCTDTAEGPRCADGKACGPEGFFLCADDCDMFLQNCPTGQKCVPYSSYGSGFPTERKCVDIGGDQQPGEPCESDGLASMNDDCALGGFCWGSAPDGGPFSGECVGLCTGSPDEPVCPPDQQCILPGQEGPFICIARCDPLADDCGPGEACYWAHTTFQCIFTNQNIPVGEPCGYINDCAAGNLCADASTLPACDGAACCTPYCNLFNPDCSDLPGTECAAFFEPGQAPAGFEHVGGCIVPP